MLKKPGSLLFFLLLSLAPKVYSQDSVAEKKERSWSINGYLKDMQTVLFSDITKEWQLENLIHNRLNFKWDISRSFRTEIGMRNRFSFGNFVQEFPDFYKAFGDDNGIVDLSWNIFTGKSYVLNSSIDRFWVDYNNGKFQVTVGRQRVNWGINFVWNPNDIFNTYSYLDFDYEEKPGSDAIRFQYYPEQTGRLEFTVKAAKDWRITAAGLYQFNRLKWDFQFLGGIMDGTDLVIGTGWSGQIAKGGFRGELSYFYPVKNISDTSGIFTGSIGYDYTFKNSLLLQFEALYNSNQAGNISTLFLYNTSSPSAMSAKNPFLSDFTLFTGISYPFNPLFSGSFSGMYNWENEVYILIPSATLSVTNNIDLMLLAQVFEIYASRAASSNVNFVFLRFKWSF